MLVLRVDLGLGIDCHAYLDHIEHTVSQNNFLNMSYEALQVDFSDRKLIQHSEADLCVGIKVQNLGEFFNSKMCQIPPLYKHSELSGGDIDLFLLPTLQDLIHKFD